MATLLRKEWKDLSDAGLLSAQNGLEKYVASTLLLLLLLLLQCCLVLLLPRPLHHLLPD